MDKEDILAKVESYLADKNYLAACLYLKNEEMPAEARYELTGEVAKFVVGDLSSERNKEKILYLRSVLVWLFKDVPGLASVYREQLRLASGAGNPLRDFARGVKNFSDFATGGASFEDKVEDAAENLKPEVIQEKVKEFFSQAGENIDEGIKRAQDFFDNLNQRTTPADSEENVRDADDSDNE